MTNEEVRFLLPGTRVQISDEAYADDVDELDPYWGEIVTVKRVDMKYDRQRVYFTEYEGPGGYFYPEEIVCIVDAPVEAIEEEYEPADISLLFAQGGVVFES